MVCCKEAPGTASIGTDCCLRFCKKHVLLRCCRELKDIFKDTGSTLQGVNGLDGVLQGDLSWRMQLSLGCDTHFAGSVTVIIVFWMLKLWCPQCKFWVLQKG